ncbi:hypothetical protein G6F68_012624 [Rhizopus microsporus]|nr:hypothetical protein G6F68_012624 [Rhizopus microsporus]
MAAESRRGAHHTAHLPHRHRSQGRIRQGADAYRHIHAFIQQVHDAIHQQGAHGHFTVRAQIAQHRRHHMQFAEEGGRRDAERAARRPHHARCGVVGLLHVIQDAAAISRVAFAGFGQAQATRGAHQQQDAQAMLQRRDAARHRGRGHFQPPGGGGKAPGLGHGQEHGHFLEAVHGGSLRPRRAGRCHGCIAAQYRPTRRPRGQAAPAPGTATAKSTAGPASPARPAPACGPWRAGPKACAPPPPDPR